MIDGRTVGLGLITCNRQAFFEKSLKSIGSSSCLDHVVVVNDGAPYPLDISAFLIQHPENCGVAIAKKDALRHLMDKGCDYIFLMEDDIVVLRPDVFSAYVELHKLSGCHHMNFGYHGPANKRGGSGGEPWPRLVINYGDRSKMALNKHVVGAFSFYTRRSIDEVGYMDEEYVNAWEHVDHTLRIIKAGLHPPFWWFPDLADSTSYLGELACSEENSAIRERKDWGDNIRNGLLYFMHKHGMQPLQIPDSPKEMVVNELKRLKNG